MTDKNLTVAADQVAAARMLMEPEFRVAHSALNWNHGHGPWEKILSVHRLVSELMDLTHPLAPWDSAVGFYSALEGKKPIQVQRLLAPSSTIISELSALNKPKSENAPVPLVVIHNELRCHPERFSAPFGYSRLYLTKDEIRRDTFEVRIDEAGEEACARPPHNLTALVGMYRTIEAIHLPSQSVQKKQVSYRKKDLDKLFHRQFAWPVGFQRREGSYTEERLPGSTKVTLQVTLYSEVNAELMFVCDDQGLYRGKARAIMQNTSEDTSIILNKESLQSLVFNAPTEISGYEALDVPRHALRPGERNFFTELQRKLEGNDAS